MKNDAIQHLPAAVGVTEAADLLGVGRSLAYSLIRSGDWPTPVIRVGRLIRIPTTPLLTLLGQEPRLAGPGARATAAE